jgi:hypothetical protein
MAVKLSLGHTMLHAALEALRSGSACIMHWCGSSRWRPPVCQCGGAGDWPQQPRAVPGAVGSRREPGAKALRNGLSCRAPTGDQEHWWMISSQLCCKPTRMR